MSSVLISIPGEPVSKPRQTRRDKWLERPCVVRYRSWADNARAEAAGKVPGSFTELRMTFLLPMPAGWSKRKKILMNRKPHTQKPDLDNLIKAVCDALFPTQDAFIHSLSAKKVWADASESGTALEFIR